MIRRFYILLCLIFLVACDDGDILTVDLAFDKTLDRCENDTQSYLIFDLKADPNESLSLIIEKNDDNELLFTEPTTVDVPVILNIDSDTRFIYRTYNRAVGNNELCDVIPPANLTVVEDYEATTGTVEVTVTIEDDDNDGVPTEFEGRGELDINGEYSNAIDTDMDGIPDYLDEDDDNDNVKTINEIDNNDGDNDPTTNPLDTDEDDIPDYLDNDDDGDGVATAEEDENGDMNPTNDLANNEDNILVPHYLNSSETTLYTFPGLTDTNEYTRTVTTSFFVRDIDLEILRATEVDFGILTTSFTLPLEDD